MPSPIEYQLVEANAQQWTALTAARMNEILDANGSNLDSGAIFEYVEQPQIIRIFEAMEEGFVDGKDVVPGLSDAERAYFFGVALSSVSLKAIAEPAAEQDCLPDAARGNIVLSPEVFASDIDNLDTEVVAEKTELGLAAAVRRNAFNGRSVFMPRAIQPVVVMASFVGSAAASEFGTEHEAHIAATAAYVTYIAMVEAAEAHSTLTLDGFDFDA